MYSNNKISVVINTYNAEDHLRKTLESLSGFDEIVVCDMESTDKTRDIAKEYNAKVVIFPKADANICEVARDFAIHSASNMWVLVVDADEHVQPALKEYLYEYISSDNPQDALFIPRAAMFMGKFTSTQLEHHVRFFRQDKAYWPPIIHAPVKIAGTIGAVPQKRQFALEHYDSPSLCDRIEKINRYSDNEVKKRVNKRYSTLSIFIRPWFFFIKTLILKGSIRDGKRGIIRAYMEMMYQVAIMGKLMECRS